MLFKQEEEIMREFGKIKTLLDTADVDEDEWDRTRGSCELLGGRLQQIRHAWPCFTSTECWSQGRAKLRDFPRGNARNLALPCLQHSHSDL